MSIFWVDYASVKDKGLAGIEKLTSEDVVYIYYNSFSSKISFSTMEHIRASSAAVQTINTGSNIFSRPVAVRIAAAFGHMLARTPDENHFIISKRLSVSNLHETAKELESTSNVVVSHSIGVHTEKKPSFFSRLFGKPKKVEEIEA